MILSQQIKKSLKMQNYFTLLSGGFRLNYFKETLDNSINSFASLIGTAKPIPIFDLLLSGL